MKTVWRYWSHDYFDKFEITHETETHYIGAMKASTGFIEDICMREKKFVAEHFSETRVDAIKKLRSWHVKLKNEQTLIINKFDKLLNI